MPETDTWETASVAPPPDPPVDPVVAAEPPAPEVPQAEAVAPEKPEAPQIEAEPAPARESESPEQIAQPIQQDEIKTEDEYVADADDPPEIALLTTPAAKRRAKRWFLDAKPIHVFDDFTRPIEEVGEQLFNRSRSRYTEHVADLAQRHSDFVSQKLFGKTVDEVKAHLQANGTPAATAPQVQSSDVPLLTEAELDSMSNEQVAQRVKEIQAATAEKLRTEYNQKYNDLKKQLDAVTGKLTTGEQQAQQAEIVTKQNEIYSKVWSVVDEVVRTSGLEASPSDPPKIASLKEAARDLLDRHNVEAAFDASEDNRKVVENVVEATKRREFQAAEREIDNLKVRARAAATTIKQSAKMKAIMEEIEAYVNQSKTQSRASDPIPPAPGSALGITIKPPSTWDEAEKPIAA